MDWDFDAYDESVMRQRRSLKWTMTPPDAMIPRSDEPFAGHGVAEMDFGTAPVVRDALTRAIDEGFLGYMPQWLRAETIDATAHFYSRRFDWEIDPASISLASSVLDGLRAMLRGMIPPHSTVIVPTPAYKMFLLIPPRLGHRVIEVPSVMDEAGLWHLDYEAIDAVAQDAELLILCNPWNPVGRILTEDELRQVGEIAQAHDLLVFSDEIHSPLVPDPAQFVPYVTVDPSFGAHTVTAVAASKGFNVAGLACAQMIVSDDCVTWAEGAQHLGYPTPLGALAATTAYRMGEPWLDALNEYVVGNIDLVDDLLEGSPLHWTRPDGTYLGWIDASALGVEDPARVFFDSTGVMLDAGIVCGQSYEQYVRMNLASSRAIVKRSVSRMLDVVKAHS
ncbi:MAG: aminotransferase class I/II-fold pyridoxal phosphate-dependent enzyme [Actinomycetaceae bacterium]|nr:aminotransferase class I/II-fold pyridoxal phosphate-dependent enzyme [Actinomycetaceae bacterium]